MQRLTKKKFSRTYRSNRGHRRSQTSRSYVYHPNLSAFGVAVPERRRLHALGEENCFDMGSSGSRKLGARDTKLGTWVHLGKAYFAPYDLVDWGALCTCSARASVLHTLSLARTYRSNGKQHRSQIRRSHAYHPNLSAFGVAVPVGRRLHAPEAESFFDMGSSGFRKL